MARFKKLLPIVQVTFSVVSLVGCSSVVTLPATSMFLILLSLLWFFLPTELTWLRTAWHFLQYVVSFQAVMFVVSLAYTFLTEVGDVWQGTLHVTTRFDPDQTQEARLRMRRKAEYRHLGIGATAVLAAAIPATCLIIGVVLWRDGQETAGIILELLGVVLQLGLLYFWYQVVATKASPYRRY